MNSAFVRRGLGLGAAVLGFHSLLGDQVHRRRIVCEATASPSKAAAVAQRKVKVTYFAFNPPFAGTAGEQLRLALAVTVGVGNFVDDRVVFQDWAKIKSCMKYAQVPMVTTDDGTELYQSGSILRWIGSSFGDGSLYPMHDPEQRLVIDEMIGVADDLQRAWDPSYNVGRFPTKYGYLHQDEHVVRRIREHFFRVDFPRYMQYFSDQLRKTGAFIAGDSVTIADCRLLPQLSYFQRGIGEHIPKNVFEPFPEVTAYLDRLRSVPQIKNWPYQESPKQSHVH